MSNHQHWCLTKDRTATADSAKLMEQTKDHLLAPVFGSMQKDPRFAVLGANEKVAFL